MESEDVLLSSLEADTGPYSKPDKNLVYIIRNYRITDHFNTLPTHI
jgi:hypothetical protein